MINRVSSLNMYACYNQVNNECLDVFLNRIIDEVNDLVTNGAGGGGVAYTTIQLSALRLLIGYQGTTEPTVVENTTGDYTIQANGAMISSVDLYGNNTTITQTGDFIIRTDGLLPEHRRWSYQIWNASNGAAHNAFASGNNPGRIVTGTVVTVSFPNMNLFGATGFELNLR